MKSSKKISRKSLKDKIKLAPSISDLKKNQVLFYYSTFPLVNVKFLSEFTGLAENEIEKIVNIPYKTKKRRTVLSKEDTIILKLVCKGLTSREIGEVVGRTFRSVETSRELIMKAFQVRNIAELIRFALKNNLVN